MNTTTFFKHAAKPTKTQDSYDNPFGWRVFGGDQQIISASFFPVTLLGVLSDLFRGENVTSIWVIKRSRMEEAGGKFLVVQKSSNQILDVFPTFARSLLSRMSSTNKKRLFNGLAKFGHMELLPQKFPV